MKLSAVLVYDGPEIRQKSLKQTAILSCRPLALTEHIYICARYESSITLDPLCFFVNAYVVTVIFKKKKKEAKRKVSNNKTKNKETLFTMTELFTSC